MIAWLTWICVAAAVLLVCAYAVGAPMVLLRTIRTVARRRRLRYRERHDALVATSRFTIPVSLILPVREGDRDVLRAVRALLDLRYPEAEVIVVADSGGPGLDALREAFDLAPCELFYRRTLRSAPVRAIYRSRTEPRLLVADKAAAGPGDARNCGVNLARYRYVGIADAAATYGREALLESMHAALEEPARVVGVTTSLAVVPEGGPSPRGPLALSLAGALRHARAARRRLASVGRRRLDLPPEGPAGFSLWRRDVLLDVEGFATGTAAVDADMIFRLHRHFRADRRRYRIVHVHEPAGSVTPSRVAAVSVGGRATAGVLRQHAGLLFNPAFGRLGVFDVPRYAFNVLLAPSIERASLVLLVLGVLIGAIAPGQWLLALFIIGLGNGVLIASALLLDAEAVTGLRPSALLNLVVVGPFEYFLRWLPGAPRPN